MRSAERALGAPGEPGAWQAEVHRLREVYSAPRVTYENVAVGPFLGTAAVHSDAALPATLDGTSMLPGRVDMNLAVGPRAIVELRGAASGQDLTAIMSGLDAAPIAARAALEH